MTKNEFKELLSKFFCKTGFDLEIKEDVFITDRKYKIDFLVSGIIIEFYKGEEECKERLEYINNYYEQKSPGDWLDSIRIEKGKEIEGIIKILKRLIQLEDITVIDGDVISYNTTMDIFI